MSLDYTRDWNRLSPEEQEKQRWSDMMAYNQFLRLELYRGRQLPAHITETRAELYASMIYHLKRSCLYRAVPHGGGRERDEMYQAYLDCIAQTDLPRPHKEYRPTPSTEFDDVGV